MEHPLVYVAIGDSLTEGLGVQEEQGFAAVYGRMMETRLGRPVMLHNAGVTGETTADIMRRLETDEALRKAVKGGDMISLTAGGNDLLNAAREFLEKRDPQVLKLALREFASNIARIMDAIRLLKTSQVEDERSPKPLVMRILNLYNPFPIFDETDYWVGRFNKEWQPYETSLIRIIDIHEAFQYRIDELISEDMVHPNAFGYRIMAEAADAAGYEGIGAHA